MAFQKINADGSAQSVSVAQIRTTASMPYPSVLNKLSQQQLEIIHCPARRVVGQALAGSGKSTTGIGYAQTLLEHQPNASILAICFNAANSLEAARKYPTKDRPLNGRFNTDVATVHSMAFRDLSQKQRARVAQRWSPVSLRNEMRMVGGGNDYRNAAAVCSILKEFFSSPLPNIDPNIHGRAAMLDLNCTQDTIEFASVVAHKLWMAMQSDDVTPGLTGQVNAIDIPHDAYLKMYVMRARPLGYHTIIFDEAQDANPIMLKFLDDQARHGSKIIYLGDRHQSIYEFRGAVNAMANLPEDAKVLPLTQSWRFGPKTADVANFILSELKGETLQLEGMGQDAPWTEGRSMAYIARTNAQLLDRAVGVNGEGVHWVGGINKYRVNLLGDAWALKCGRVQDIRDPYLRKHFPSWGELTRAAEFDHETKILFNLVEQYDEMIPELEESLYRNEVKSVDDAQIILTTGHGSKGLEFDFVQMENDYRGVFDNAESWLAEKSNAPFPEQEVNLAYMVATRAKSQFLPCMEMLTWFEKIDHHRRRRKRDFSQADSETTVYGAAREPASGAATTPASRAFANIKPMTVR